MLIDSPRLTPLDRKAWAQLERYDAALARTPRMHRLATQAVQTIREFAAVGPCYASTSWGKDSTCMSHLVAVSGVRLPLVYVRMQRWENPDCLTVRDRFLERYGDLVDYHEYEVPGGPRWWTREWQLVEMRKSGSHVGRQFAEAEAHHGKRHISGVRAEESSIRALAQARWGDAGPGACRPLGRWKATDVFAYLHLHDLPVHPAYAMSHGGQMDRRWLRVSPIGGISAAHKQRADWEACYYADMVPDYAGGRAGHE